MKKILIAIAAFLAFSSCKGCYSTMEEKQKGVTEVCPTCVLTWSSNGKSSGFWCAQDTAKKPNVVYDVTFCQGVYYASWKVDYMTKIN